MNKIKAKNFIQQIKENLYNENNHLTFSRNHFDYDKLRDYSYNDDIMAVVTNETTQNDAIIFKSGITFFVSTLHDIDEGSEIRRYTGHSTDGLIALLNYKFSKSDYEKPINYLSNQEFIINH